MGELQALESILRPELLSWWRDGIKSSADGQGSFTAPAALLCICGGLKLDRIKGVIYNQSLG